MNVCRTVSHTHVILTFLMRWIKRLDLIESNFIYHRFYIVILEYSRSIQLINIQSNN